MVVAADGRVRQLGQVVLLVAVDADAVLAEGAARVDQPHRARVRVVEDVVEAEVPVHHAEVLRVVQRLDARLQLRPQGLEVGQRLAVERQPRRAQALQRLGRQRGEPCIDALAQLVAVEAPRRARTQLVAVPPEAPQHLRHGGEEALPLRGVQVPEQRQLGHRGVAVELHRHRGRAVLHLHGREQAREEGRDVLRQHADEGDLLLELRDVARGLVQHAEHRLDADGVEAAAGDQPRACFGVVDVMADVDPRRVRVAQRLPLLGLRHHLDQVVALRGVGGRAQHGAGQAHHAGEGPRRSPVGQACVGALAHEEGRATVLGRDGGPARGRLGVFGDLHFGRGREARRHRAGEVDDALGQRRARRQQFVLQAVQRRAQGVDHAGRLHAAHHDLVAARRQFLAHAVFLAGVDHHQHARHAVGVEVHDVRRRRLDAHRQQRRAGRGAAQEGQASCQRARRQQQQPGRRFGGRSRSRGDRHAAVEGGSAAIMDAGPAARPLDAPQGRAGAHGLDLLLKR